MDIKIESLENQKLETMGVEKWPVWSKDVSIFDWHYDSMEECFFLDGRVKVHTENGDIVEIKKGDFVTFNEGLSCRWEVLEPIRKHYRFK